MGKKLIGMNIAMLAYHGFEEREMTQPRKALEAEGAVVHLISPEPQKIKSWVHGDWSKDYKVDVKLESAKPQNYDGVVLPGGVINPDKLRTHKEAIQFIKHFFKKNKLVAAICHGPQVLIETGQLKGRSVTSYYSIKTDLINAGANWKNKQVMVDENLITSRNPDDIPAFNQAIIKYLSKRKD